MHLARAALQSGHRSRACMHVKYKQRLVAAIATAQQQLDSVYALQQQLEQSQSHAQLLHCMQLAGNALREAQRGLSLDSIDAVQDELAEQLSLQSLVDGKISSTVHMDSNGEEESLEEEFEEMQREMESDAAAAAAAAAGSSSPVHEIPVASPASSRSVALQPASPTASHELVVS